MPHKLMNDLNFMFNTRAILYTYKLSIILKYCAIYPQHVNAIYGSADGDFRPITSWDTIDGRCLVVHLTVPRQPIGCSATSLSQVRSIGCVSKVGVYSDASSHQLSSPTNAQHIRYRRFSLLPTSSFKMSVKLSRVATSEYDELLLLLDEGTTHNICNCKYSAKDFEDILVKGGLSKFNPKTSLSLLTERYREI